MYFLTVKISEIISKTDYLAYVSLNITDMTLKDWRHTCHLICHR